jgi:hypothetical protein
MQREAVLVTLLRRFDDMALDAQLRDGPVALRYEELLLEVAPC